MLISGIPLRITDWSQTRMGYPVADSAEPHRSCTHAGDRLFIVD